PRQWADAFVALLWFGFFFLVAYGLVWLGSLTQGAFERWRFRRDRGLWEKMTLRLSSGGITLHDLNGVTTTFWHALEQVGETDDHAFFYITKTLAHILPKRAFRDKEEFRQFVATARHYHDEARRFVRTEGQA